MNIEFDKTALEVTPQGGIMWRLDAPFVVTLDGEKLTLPTGFRTDFASSWIFGFDLLNRRATYSIAAVVHDYLYATAPFEKAKCDTVFRNILAIEGVGYFERWKAYLGVAIFGGFAWRAHRKNPLI